MRPPFTADQFFDVFRRYDEGVWPAQIALNVIGVIVAAAAWRAHARRSWTWARVAIALPAALWHWTGIVYFETFFVTITPAGEVFGSFFIPEAALLLLTAWLDGPLQRVSETSTSPAVNHRLRAAAVSDRRHDQRAALSRPADVWGAVPDDHFHVRRLLSGPPPYSLTQLQDLFISAFLVRRNVDGNDKEVIGEKENRSDRSGIRPGGSRGPRLRRSRAGAGRMRPLPRGRGGGVREDDPRRAFARDRAHAGANCSSCHIGAQEHAASGGEKKPLPLERGDGADAPCLSCHGGKKGQAHWEGSAHQLAALACGPCHDAEVPELPRTDARGAASALVAPLQNGQMDCASCYNPQG